MLTYGTASYIYGKRGNLQAKVIGMDTTKYFYDNLGNLNSVVLADGTVIDYIIDGQNRRIAKLLNGSIVKKWLYQDAINPVAELDSANNVIARYVYGTKANVPEYIVKNDTTYKVVSDHLGSVRMVVNTSNGSVAQRIDYDAWGNQVSNLGSDICNLSFAGGLTDEHTGLIRFGARDYDALTGRWTSKDPIGFGGGVSNLYEYCVNDPVNFIDPSGLQSTITSEEYRKDLQKLISLYEQLIENNIDCEQREKNRESIASYLWQPPTFLEGLDQSVPIVLDGAAIAALYAGQIQFATVLGGTSTLWTLKNEGLSSVSTWVGLGTTVAGAYKPLRYPMAAGQLIYDVHSTKK